MISRLAPDDATPLQWAGHPAKAGFGTSRLCKELSKVVVSGSGAYWLVEIWSKTNMESMVHFIEVHGSGSQ